MFVDPRTYHSSGGDGLSQKRVYYTRLTAGTTYNQGMRSIEEYLENAPTLAQDIVNEWGLNVKAGNGSVLSEEFLALNEYACRYIDARAIADNHREFNSLTEEDAARETATRRTCAEAYKTYWERVSGQAETATPSPKSER